MGKAMLAGLASGQAGAAAQGPASRPLSRRARALKRELDLVRRRGYAIDNEENEPGVACIGAAILNASSVPVAAISVSGPAHRILVEKKHISAAVMAAGRRVSRSLGYTAPGGPEGRR
jgi:DNA-binding IclR family transcriptional regulator